MKNLGLLFSLMLCFILISNSSKACVDYHPIPPSVTVVIDSTWTNFEITVHELNIFAGGPGAFCTCALSEYQILFSSIYYVAFVDSGTINPVAGFDLWNSNSFATSEWSGVMAGTSWDGYVASVISSMTPGQPVELIIKAQVPVGYLTFSDVDSSLALANLGTDEWDDSMSTLAWSHNSVSGFGNRTYSLVSPSYFMAGYNEHDNEIVTHFFPNPFSESTNVYFSKQLNSANVHLFDLFGNKVVDLPDINGSHIIIERGKLSSGVYLMKVIQEGKLISDNKMIVID